jgi:hypothetical protein
MDKVQNLDLQREKMMKMEIFYVEKFYLNFFFISFSIFRKFWRVEKTTCRFHNLFEIELKIVNLSFHAR